MDELTCVIEAWCGASARLGQHNEAIYRDWLGCSSQQLAAWKAAGVF